MKTRNTSNPAIMQTKEITNSKSTFMKKLQFSQMEQIQGGRCAPGLAIGAFASAVASIFFPPAAVLSINLIGHWAAKCL